MLVGEMDWKIMAQIVVYAFGAGGVVQQLRTLNTNVRRVEGRLDETLKELTRDMRELRDRIGSLESWREFLQQRGEE